MTWDGVFQPFRKGQLTDHFKIVSVERGDIFATIRVEFDKSPGKLYAYEIPIEEWDGKKDSVADLIQEG